MVLILKLIKSHHKLLFFKRQIVHHLCLQKCFKLPENRVAESTFCFEVLMAQHLLLGCVLYWESQLLTVGEGTSLDLRGGADWGVFLPHACVWPMSCLGFQVRQSTGDDRHLTE